MTSREWVLLGIVATFAAIIVWLVRRRRPTAQPGARRILVPFVGRLDDRVLQAAIRIARAESAVLVPASLVVVPWNLPEESPLRAQVEAAMPLLEAVEHAALRAGVPVDARIEKGRTRTHALRRLWEVEHFDRVVAPAEGFTPKELTWILANAPAETVILRPLEAAAA